MRHTPAIASILTLALATSAVWAAERKAGRTDDTGFTSIFDGKTLAGWHVSSKTGHGSGGRWVVEDGAITGSQDKPGNGGIIITDRQYGDFVGRLNAWQVSLVIRAILSADN